MHRRIGCSRPAFGVVARSTAGRRACATTLAVWLGLLGLAACGESGGPSAGVCGAGERRCDAAGAVEVCLAGQFVYLSPCPAGLACLLGQCVAGSDAGADGVSPDAAPPDAGADAAPPDAGADAAPPDAGGPDAAAPDAGFDAAPPDAGQPDAAASDAGLPDAGAEAAMPDAGLPDAAPADTAGPDAGGPDAAPADTAGPDWGLPDARWPDAGPGDVPQTCPEVVATAFGPQDPNIQYFGRFDRNTFPETPAASWSGTYIRARFVGTGIRVRLASSGSDYLYHIDGGEMQLLRQDSEAGAPFTATLATCLAPGEHEVAVYRRSEGSFGMYAFHGFVVENGSLLAPAPPSPRSLECMGDSITAGFAADGPGNSRDTNSTLSAWCVQTALRVDAEWSVVAHSGQGLYQNLYGTGQVEYGHVITMVDEFQWTHFPGWSAAPGLPWDYNYREARIPWDFAPVPGAVLFAIGTNDYITAPAGSGAEALAFDAAFAARYHEFLDIVRAHYPATSTAIFILGILLPDETWAPHGKWDRGNAVMSQVVAERVAAGDTRIFFLNPRPNFDNEGMWLNDDAIDYSGDRTHPSRLGHAKIADHVAAALGAQLGWNPAPCLPACAGRACGPDGCGGVCGTCPGAAVCQDGVCVAAPDLWVTGYLPAWEHYVEPGGAWGHLRTADIDWRGLTHLIYFVAEAFADGSVGPIQPYYNLNAERLAEIVPAAHAHGVPILLSVGGWGNTAFQQAIAPGVRGTFVANLVAALTRWGFDGLDIDMEPIRDEDRTNYAAFIEALAAALAAVDVGADYLGEQPIVSRPLLTAAMMTNQPALFGALAPHFDQLNLMTYDMSGPWPGWVTWHNAPLTNGGHTFPATGGPLPSAAGEVARFLEAGVPAAKLGIGTSFHGRVWSGGRLANGDGSVNPTAGVSAPRQRWHEAHVPTATAIAYRDLVVAYGLGADPSEHPAYRFDADAAVPYLTVTAGGPDDHRFISFDDARACREKVAYVRREGLGGLIVWDLTAGFLADAPLGWRHPLLEALRDELAEPTLP